MALLRLILPFYSAPLLLFFCSVLVASVPPGATAVEAKRNFDLPSGEAVETLRQFAAASGRSLVFVTEKVRGEKTRAVRGTLAPRDALDRMLADSRLKVTEDTASGALVISRMSSTENVPRQCIGSF